MGIFTKTTVIDDVEEDESESQRLLNQLAETRAELRAATSQVASAGEVNRLKDEVERLKREQARMQEDTDRQVRQAREDADRLTREAEHAAGLLLTQREFEIDSAKREAILTVREGNLKAEQDRLEGQMKFQREFMAAETTRLEGVLDRVFERMPQIDVALTSQATAAPSVPKARASRPAD